jgi:hypothetical protein
VASGLGVALAVAPASAAVTTARPASSAAHGGTVQPLWWEFYGSYINQTLCENDGKWLVADHRAKQYSCGEESLHVWDLFILT